MTALPELFQQSLHNYVYVYLLVYVCDIMLVDLGRSTVYICMCRPGQVCLYELSKILVSHIIMHSLLVRKSLRTRTKSYTLAAPGRSAVLYVYRLPGRV
jgi:hypothetical protein